MKSLGHRLLSLTITIIVAGLLSASIPGSTQAVNRPVWLDKAEYVKGDTASVIVFLENDSLTGELHRAAAPVMTRGLRIKAISARLKSHRPAADGSVKAFLADHALSGIQQFWIVPAFKATLSVKDIESVSAMPGVSSVVPDVPVEGIEPVEIKAATTSAASSSTQVRVMNVPYLWAKGITGTGRLVCSFDTGVQSDHPALSGNWRGSHSALSASWFSTVSPTTAPVDKAGHGSHTMGIMVGIEGTDTIGVAPGAEWITAGVIDQGKSLSATFADILAAFQWALDPDGDPNTTDDVPDVILNSWGVPGTLFTPCDNTFFAAIDNVEAAGIVCIFSAGNEGPNASTLRNPASRATSPLNAFAVGAVDNSKVIAAFSSRGPGGCGLTDIKPEVVAPGVDVRSVNKDGGYKTMTGTSMAAPFVAGLVALCRQYNPDATVEEIKTAIIESAQDLGVAGEDNNYGYGLPDATKILDYLPSSGQSQFLLNGYSISGDGIALPGETFNLQITLTRTSGSIETVIGQLLPTSTSLVSVLNDTVGFYFGAAGTTSIGYESFSVYFDPSLIHGDSVTLSLRIMSFDGQPYDTLEFSIPVGYSPNGTIGNLDGGQVSLTVSDFGQYGFAAGSIYNLGGLGLRSGTSANLLYEGGIVLGRNALQLSSSVRGEDGTFSPSEFVPVVPLSEVWEGEDGGEYRTGQFSDALADVSIPVKVTQQVTDYSASGDNGIVIVKYWLINTSLTTLNDLSFGFLSDFDLPDGAETVVFDGTLGLLVQSGASGPAVGLVGLSGLPRHQTLANDTAKVGFSDSQLYAMISSNTSVDLADSGDLMSMLTGGPYRLTPGDSVEIALAIVTGATSSEVRSLAARAKDIYSQPTGVDDPPGVLPQSYELYQNYPNPFNPTTMIEFALPQAGDVTLEVFNLLGQQVRKLYSGYLPAGSHTLQWDACDNDGGAVASGVYFYRLSTDGYSRSRKMILLR